MTKSRLDVTSEEGGISVDEPPDFRSGVRVAQIFYSERLP
jgi:hypothetical protein